MTFSDKIKAIRTHFKWNQSELASNMGISRSVISEFEGGTRQPSREFIVALPNIGVSVDWFLSGVGQMFHSETFETDVKYDKMSQLTWKDRMARIHELVGLNDPQDLPFCFGYKDHGLIWGLINGKTSAPTEEELSEMIRVFGLSEDWVKTGQEPVFRKGFNYVRPAEKYKREHPKAIKGPAAELEIAQAHDGLQSLPFQGAEALKDPGAFLIPLIDQPVSAGGGTELNGHDEVHSFIPVPKALRRYGNRLAAVPVRGDSMEPTIYHDDMVVCDTCGWEGDGIYVLRMRDGAYVKRLAVRPQGLRVISDNKAYDAYDVNPESEGVTVVGRVRCVLKVVR